MALTKLELCVAKGATDSFRTDWFRKDCQMAVFSNLLRVQIILQFYQTK